MNSRAITAIATAGVLFGLACAVWILMPTSEDGASTETDAQRRERFFGSHPKKDIRGGQEMRPRW